VEGKLVRGNQRVNIGDRLRVRLLSTNVDKGFIDFARA
jgi:exoribonuclease-2